ncbi:cytochrome P450 [Archangium lipolyticum]|uniref:cytochrome P450 n=1 Tax=Archangium lipolyticum TaxID=2970465 RepID=UPI00214A81FF|nr:cytochrome P450 [Archangium lipolyticum]
MTDLNPVSPENIRDPYPLYKELRDNHPVHWSEVVHAWIITRYDDVVACFRDPRLSTNRLNFYSFQLQGSDPAIAEDVLGVLSKQMAMKDGIDHLRVRRHASQGFSPQALDAWRPSIRRIMTMLVDRVHAEGRMDVVSHISYQLPPLVIADLMGVPPEDRGLFQSWAKPIAQFSSPTVGVDMVEVTKQANRAMQEFKAYLFKIVEERRHHPGQDVLSQMIHFQEGGGMSMDELLSNANLILTAGHVTVTDQLTTGLHNLLSHPDQLQKLREDRSLIKSAVEEMLRYSPALPFSVRIAKQDIQLHGKTIPKDSVVFLGSASANRDPKVFPDPDRFDITRDHIHQKHLGFGFGAHHCLGAGLARRELEIALEVMLDRMPGLRLDEDSPPRLKLDTLFFRGFNSMHVRW